MSVTKNLREFILVRDVFTCRYCYHTPRRVGSLVIDHVDPIGGNAWRNLVTACWSCNSEKGDKYPNHDVMKKLWDGYDWVVVVNPGWDEKYFGPSENLVKKLRLARCFSSEAEAEHAVAERLLLGMYRKDKSVVPMAYREAELKRIRLTLRTRDPGFWNGPSRVC